MILTTNFEKHERARRQQRNHRSHLVYSQKVVDFLTEEVESQLLRLFQIYCSQGEPLNLTKLKTYKFLKFLRHIGVIDEVTESSLYESPKNRSSSSIAYNFGEGQAIRSISQLNFDDNQPFRFSYNEKPNIINHSNFKSHNSTSHYSQKAEIEEDADEVYTSKPFEGYQTKVRMAEYNDAPTEEIDYAGIPSFPLKIIEIDLIIQYLVTPAIKEDPSKHERLEVISIAGNKRQFLVNPEERKEDYKFGSSCSRSSFLPEEMNNSQQFYINLETLNAK